jgi:hypothetical protein
MSRFTVFRASLLASVLLFSVPALAQDLVKEQAPSDVKITATTPKGDVFDIAITNRRYETNIMASTLGGPEILYQLLLIEESHESKEGLVAEPDTVSAKVKVTAFPMTEKGKGAASFTIEADGNEAKAGGPYLTVTRYGCCVEQPTYAIYSLENGAYLFNATGTGDSGQWATLGAPGGWKNERILAFHAAPTAADEVILKGAENAQIAISYATTTKPLQRVLVTVPKSVIDGDIALEWAPKLELITKDQPDGSDRVFIDRKDDDPAKLFTGVTVRLTLDDKTKIEIPLEGDMLKLDAAKLPEGYALVAVKP